MKLPTHLLGLPKDPRTGWPAPYVNAWTSEQDEADLTIVPGPTPGTVAVHQPERVGHGHVDFKAQNLTRARKTVLSGWCQVCRAPKARTLIVGPGLSGEVIQIGQVRYVAFTEPWICERCALFAMTHCPGLIRRKHDEIVHTINTTRGNPQVVFSTGTHDLFPKHGNRVILFAKIAVPLGSLPDGADGWFPQFRPDPKAMA